MFRAPCGVSSGKALPVLGRNSKEPQHLQPNLVMIVVYRISNYISLFRYSEKRTHKSLGLRGRFLYWWRLLASTTPVLSGLAERNYLFCLPLNWSSPKRFMNSRNETHNQLLQPSRQHAAACLHGRHGLLSPRRCSKDLEKATWVMDAVHGCEMRFSHMRFP